LRTLRDGADLIGSRFATVTNWRLLEVTIELLMQAARSGKHDDVKAATESLERVLRVDPGRRRRRLTQRPLRMRARSRRGLYPANCR
jgi:hypothetical protein